MPKQTNKGKALAALLANGSIRDAAKACRLSEETLYRFLRDPAFLKEYRDAGRQTVENAIRKLQKATGEAVETLQRNLHFAKTRRWKAGRLKSFSKMRSKVSNCWTFSNGSTRSNYKQNEHFIST